MKEDAFVKKFEIISNLLQSCKLVRVKNGLKRRLLGINYDFSMCGNIEMVSSTSF